MMDMGEEARRKDTTLGWEAAGPSMFGGCSGGESADEGAMATRGKRSRVDGESSALAR